MSERTPREFLESMAMLDEVNSHDPAECGQCFQHYDWARIAREMIANGEDGADAVSVWSERAEASWQASKFYQLWQTEKAAGRDPMIAFRERGWLQ